MNIAYPAKLTSQKGGKVLVEFVDLPDTFTEGESTEEALFNASEVLSGMLELRLEDGDKIPAPSKARKGWHMVSPDAKIQAVMLLKVARGDRSLADLARAIETSWPQVKRLENPKHWPSLRTLERAAAALGKKLVLSFE